MSRRHHHHMQPYDYERFTDHSHRDRERDQARGIEYQDDSLSSINSDEDSYLHHQHSSKDKKSNFYNTKNESTSKPSKPDKSSNPEPYHPKEVKVQAPHAPPSESNATMERLGRLETMLEELIKRNNPPPAAPPTPSVAEKPVKPPTERRGQFSLEPRRHDFTTSMWINKIQEVSVQNNWDEKTTISYMGSQMSGIIKAWYNSLPNYDYTWPEWKILISKMFPDNTDFITSLKRLVTRLKQADESMTTYYFSKTYLIEACKITGEDAVSCLIDGLNNQSIQEQAKTQNYLTPETLYSQYLMVLPEYTVDYAPTVPPTAETVLNNWYYEEEQNPESAEIDTEVVPEEQLFDYEKDGTDFDYRNQNPNFRNEKQGRAIKSPPKRQVPVHSRLDKRFIRPNNFKQNKVPLAAKVCNICLNRGHLARNCRKADKMMCFKLHKVEHNQCFRKDCVVNQCKVDAFIDTGSTCVSIRHSVARDLNLKIAPISDCLEVYGGGLIPVVGETEFSLEVDSVRASVKAVVVPDHVQDVSVVVGQEFLNQKDVCVFLQNQTLKIFEASYKLTD